MIAEATHPQATTTAASARTPRRPRRGRDLSRALHYRAADIFELHGIPASTLCELARRPVDPIPSRLIAPRGGRRGLRLFPVAETEAWIARQGTATQCRTT